MLAEKGVGWVKDNIFGQGQGQDQLQKLLGQGQGQLQAGWQAGGQAGKVTTTEWDKAMNDLANVVSTFGEHVDPENMYKWFGEGSGNLIMNAQPAEIIKLANSMQGFLSAANYIKAEVPDIAKIFLDWIKDYVNRTMDLGRTTSEITKYTDILNDRTAPRDAYVVAMLEKNYNLAGILSVMYTFNNPTKETYSQLSDLSKLSQEMLGPQFGRLINDKALLSEKAQTNFQMLQKSRALFYLLTPVQIGVEHFKQWEQKKLADIYGSDTAKALTNNFVFKTIFGLSTQTDWLLKNINSQSWGDVVEKGSWQ